MISTIDDRRVKNFISKNNSDPYFPKWQDLPWSQQIIFILKEIVNELNDRKREIRELKGEIIEPENPEDEYEPEEKEIEEVAQEDIYDEPIDLSFMNGEKDEKSA